jgi:hypothetical protein
MNKNQEEKKNNSINILRMEAFFLNKIRVGTRLVTCTMIDTLVLIENMKSYMN